MIVLLSPFQAVGVVCRAAMSAVVKVPLIGPLLSFCFMVLLVPGGWLMFVYAGAVSDAKDGKVTLEESAISFAITPRPIRDPRVRRVYRIQWQDVSKVQLVLARPFSDVPQLEVNDGTVFMRGLTSDWSKLVGEAKRRGLFDDTGTPMHRPDAVLI